MQKPLRTDHDLANYREKNRELFLLEYNTFPLTTYHVLRITGPVSVVRWWAGRHLPGYRVCPWWILYCNPGQCPHLPVSPHVLHRPHLWAGWVDQPGCSTAPLQDAAVCVGLKSNYDGMIWNDYNAWCPKNSAPAKCKITLPYLRR